MGKSIESIWKEGFLKNEVLVAPKLNDLYNQKSKSIIEKIRRMMKINLLLIVIFSFLILIWWYFTDVVYIGFFIFVLLNAFAIYAKKKMNGMRDIDRGENSYQYLKSFNSWLKSILSKNVKIMRFFYPLMFLASAATAWFSNDNEIFLKEIFTKANPDILMIGGIPLVVLSVVVVIAIIMAYFGEKIYRWDVNLVYGGVFRKLEEIIADMEELRA